MPNLRAYYTNASQIVKHIGKLTTTTSAITIILNVVYLVVFKYFCVAWRRGGLPNFKSIFIMFSCLFYATSINHSTYHLMQKNVRKKRHVCLSTVCLEEIGNLTS